VVLIRELVRHFQDVPATPDQQEAQRIRLMLASHLDDGEFARLIYKKIEGLIGPMFIASLRRAIEAGEAKQAHCEPMNLFWFAHHTVLMSTLTRLPATPCLCYGDAGHLERQLCEFILRGIGVSETAIADYLNREILSDGGQPGVKESVRS